MPFKIDCLALLPVSQSITARTVAATRSSISKRFATGSTRCGSASERCYAESTESRRLSVVDDQIIIELHREDAAALVHVLDSLIDQQHGTATGDLLRGLNTALIDARGHVKPDPL